MAKSKMEGRERVRVVRGVGCAADVGSWIGILGGRAERDGGKETAEGAGWLAGSDGCQGQDGAKVMVKRRRELGWPCVRVPWLVALEVPVPYSIPLIWYQRCYKRCKMYRYLVELGLQRPCFVLRPSHRLPNPAPQSSHHRTSNKRQPQLTIPGTPRPMVCQAK